jgi:argininosuccinate synthase
VRDWGMGRDDTIRYAHEHDLPIETTKSSPYSIDENLWGRSIECGILEDPWAAPPEDVYELTRFDAASPASREVEVTFEKGVPVALDGESLSPLHLVEAVGKVAGSFGFGRIDTIEDRLVGIKSREVYEAPAALALIAAHADLESLTLERTFAREKRRLEDVWADLVYEGLWFSPLREAIDAFASACNDAVTGTVRLRFAPGSCTVTGRSAEKSLYDHGLATYDAGDVFRHEDAAGFIRLWGLPTKQWAETHG